MAYERFDTGGRVATLVGPASWRDNRKLDAAG